MYRCSLKNISLTLKALVLTLVISGLVWIVLDYWQQGTLQGFFFTELAAELEVKAVENRLAFDQHLRAHLSAAKIIVSQQRFQTYISSSKWKENNQQEVENHYNLPRWLPGSSTMQAFFVAKYALLIDSAGTVREIYYHIPDPIPQTLLKLSVLHQKRAVNQAYLTTIEGAPYILSAYTVADEMTEEPIATLLLASRMDGEFLREAVKTFSPQEDMVVALIESGGNIWVSSNPELLPAGAKVSDYEKDFLLLGTSYFDYGESELKAGLASFIPTQRAYHLAHEILGQVHYQRIMFALALLGTFIALMFWITHRIRGLTKQIVEFSRDSLGVENYQAQGIQDEVEKIASSFEQLRDSIKNTIALANSIAAGNYVQQTASSERDQLGRALYEMNNTLQNQAKVLRDQQDELLQINENLEQRVVERTQELAAASEEIKNLNQQLQEENLRMGAELNITRRLQQMILPTEDELSNITGLDIAGFMEPATEVGGDYYDILQQDGRVKIGIGDVTGHGLESGVLMLMVQTAIRTLLASNIHDPEVFVNVLNSTIYNNVKRMKTDKNLTLALVDYHEGLVRLSGQHEEMLVVRQNGKIKRIDTIDLGFILGIEADISPFVAHYEEHLQEGEGIVLYTDGIIEARDEQMKMYGLDRLCEVITQNWQRQPARGVQQAVITDVRRHIGEQKVFDDLTLVIIKRNAERTEDRFQKTLAHH